eukprot:13151696-Ditylum_brightwellii.AAC.1
MAEAAKLSSAIPARNNIKHCCKGCAKAVLDRTGFRYQQRAQYTLCSQNSYIRVTSTSRTSTI